MRQGHALARSLLDCAESADCVARQGIDDALRRRSSDAAVHAAALMLAFVDRSDSRLSRSHARGWVPGFHELVDSGHLDAAAYALPRLRTAYPRVSYLEYMEFVFEQLPSKSGSQREPLVDDRARDVQVATTPNAETVVLAFCGATHQLGISINLLDRWFARLRSHVVYLRDRQKIGFTGGIDELGEDMPTTLEALRRLVREIGAERVVCVGNSAGATGALRYAQPLGADRVLALAPITGGPKYVKLVAPHLPPGAVMPWSDLVPLYREGRGVRVRVMYGAKNAGDRQQSHRMAGLPGVTVEAVPNWESHHLVGGLLLAGQLEQALDWLVTGSDAEDVQSITSSDATTPRAAHSPPAGGHCDNVTNGAGSRDRGPAAGSHEPLHRG